MIEKYKYYFHSFVYFFILNKLSYKIINQFFFINFIKKINNNIIEKLNFFLYNVLFFNFRIKNF